MELWKEEPWGYNGTWIMQIRRICSIEGRQVCTDLKEVV